MSEFKKTFSNLAIGSLLTVMAWVGGLWDFFTAPSTQMTTGYVAPVVQSSFDWWWSRIMWSLLPMTIVVGLLCGIGIVFVAIRNVSKPIKPKKEPVQYEVLQPGRPTKMMPLETPPVERGFSDGLKKLTRTTIPLGYTKTGEIVTWDVTQAPHIRVHGKTQGSGKTNLIKAIAACAVRIGHHVVVLDRRGFKDWRDFEQHAELIDNRKEGVFSNVTSQVKSLYQKRDSVLGQYGVGNIEELPKKYKRVFVVIAEFGTACREIADDELLKVVKDLKSIMSESGATGVHLIYESQVVNHDWPRELRGNGDPVCGYLPEDTAKAGGYSYAYQLKPYEFHYDDEKFRTWDMKKYAWQVLGMVQPTGDRLIVARSQPVTWERFGNGLGTHFPEGNAGNVPVPKISNQFKNIYERSRSWEEVAKVWFALNPDAEHADWCRAMAEIADDGRPYTDFKGRLSSSLFHQYSPKGKGSSNDNLS